MKDDSVTVGCRKCSLRFEFDSVKEGFNGLVEKRINSEIVGLYCPDCDVLVSLRIADQFNSGIWYQFFALGSTTPSESIRKDLQMLDLSKKDEDFLKRQTAKSPFELMVHWIIQREKIRSHKEMGMKPPWTEDSILDRYRFCNVRRMDDRVSKWLYDNWYKPYYNHPNMLYATGLARFINLPASLNEITGLVFGPGKGYPNYSLIKKALRKRRDAGNVIFNGAYMVRGNDGQDKIESVVDFYVKGLRDAEQSIDRSSMENTHAAIQSCYGMGSFMAGQIVADLRWAMDGSWRDKMTWAPIGPGSQRGLNRVLERPTNQSMKQEEFLGLLQELIRKLSSKLPRPIVVRLEAHDYQNVLCETDKYLRTLYNEGRPKQKYNWSNYCA